MSGEVSLLVEILLDTLAVLIHSREESSLRISGKVGLLVELRSLAEILLDTLAMLIPSTRY